MRAHLITKSVLAALLVAAACDSPPEPTLGNIQVSVSTTGGDVDLNGYVARVDAVDLLVAVNGSVELSGLATGAHRVELLDVAPNCTVSGENPRNVTIRGGATTGVAFQVACAASGVQVTVATTGLDPDPDGYLVSVGTASSATLLPNGSATIGRLTPGTYAVLLSGVAANCTVAGENPRDVTVTIGEHTPVAFAVSCVAATAAIQVTTVTAGADLDPNGYTVQVDEGSPVPIATNGTATVAQLAAGDRSVRLDGVAGNCTVAGENPRVLSVTTGGTTRDTARTTFEVTCISTTGTLRVAAATSGAELDPDGYTVLVDEYCYYYYYTYCYYAFNGPVGVNGSVSIPGLSVGDHTVRLDGVARNCLVDGANPRTVTVLSAATVEATFTVTCLQTGSVEVTAATTGADLDPNGYVVALDGAVMDTSAALAINATALIAGLVAGDYSVSLGGVAANCAVTGPNPRPVTVAGGATATVAFDVSCAALGGLQVTTSTAGVDLDEDGYNVGVVGPGFSGSRDVATNGTVTFGPLAPGDYSVTLNGVAVNCEVAAPHPRTVTVPSGVTATVALDVGCAAARELAVALDAGGNTDVYVVKANGAGLTRLTTHAAYDADPAWSPDGSKIAFASDRDGNREIYVMDANGQNQVRLTTAAGLDYHPAWSPDGAQIAFVSERAGNLEIYVMDASGANPTRVTNHAAIDADPAWSSQDKIAFWSTRDGNGEIYVMDPNGSNLTRLTVNTVDDVQPDWSPDGTQLVFSQLTGCSLYGACDYDLYTMTASGSGAARVNSGTTSDTEAAWSPDGLWIAFTAAYCDYYYGCYPGGVQVVRVDGSRAGQVTSSAFHPAWRP